MKVDDNGVITFTIQPHDCAVCGHKHGGRDVAYVCVGCSCPETPGKASDSVPVASPEQIRALAGRGSWLAGNAAALISQQQATPHEKRYHTFEFRDSTKNLTKHPPDWYDGKPKRCPGSGVAPAVQFHGELSDDGEPKYLCRCPWCDVPQRPGPMPEHTFVPVRIEDITFRQGPVLEGIEPTSPLDAPRDLCGYCGHPLGEHPTATGWVGHCDVETWHLACAESSRLAQSEGR